MKGIRIIWKSHNSTSIKGYLRISIRNSDLGKTKIISLNLPPISERHFDKSKQRVKSSFKDYISYNEEIERVLNDYDLKKHSNIVKDEKKTLNYLINNILIPNSRNEGTKEKYKNILNLLILFNKLKYNRDEVYMKSIDVNYINEWKNWLRNERKLLENTISYKTKTFSSFISKSINEEYYLYVPNPFKSIKNRITETQIDYLSEDELNRLITTELFEINRDNRQLGSKKDIINKGRYKNSFTINEVRMWFLFQLFQHGLRVSDLMTLRWNNFYFDENELRIKKRMIKTKHSVQSMIYYPTMYILLNYIPNEILTMDEIEEIERIKEVNTKMKNKFYNQNKKTENKKVEIKFRNIFNFNFEKKDEKTYLVSQKCIENEIKFIRLSIEKPSFDIKSLLENTSEKIDFDLEIKMKNDERVIQLKELLEVVKIEVKKINTSKLDRIENFNNRLYELLTIIILRLKKDKNYSNKFVFPILNDEDFTDIKKEEDFDKMNKIQYLRFVGRRGYYNRLLKYVGEQCNISNLTSHKSRHSYTSLLLKNNKDINLYDLMKSLGHKNLHTTQGYIQNFVNKRVDDMGKSFSDKFSTNFNTDNFNF
jgi:integrase